MVVNDRLRCPVQIRLDAYQWKIPIGTVQSLSRCPLHARDDARRPAVKRGKHSSTITTPRLYARPALQHHQQAHVRHRRRPQITESRMSPGQTNIQEHHIHGFLGYVTVAASILTIGSTIALLLGQYERAGRSLSTRQGVQRRRLVQIFLGLALACFVVITTLKYANPVVRAETASTLAGAHQGASGGTGAQHETRTADGRVVADGNEALKMQKEIPSR